MTLPRITIVTVCRNALPALKQTVCDVLQQDYPDFEQIVVDGASTDGTTDYLATVSNPHLTWTSEPDKGIYDAMNKGARRATGEWIIFMNAGDKFADKEVLRKVFETSRSEADIVYGDVLKNGVVKVAQQPRNSHRMFFCHQCVFVRTTLAQQFPFDTAHKMSADFKFFKLMFHQQRRFVKVDRPIAIFDTTGVSNSHRSDGLLDNIRIVREMDPWQEQLRLLPHLVFPYLMCRIRKK